MAANPPGDPAAPSGDAAALDATTFGVPAGDALALDATTFGAPSGDAGALGATVLGVPDGGVPVLASLLHPSPTLASVTSMAATRPGDPAAPAVDDTHAPLRSSASVCLAELRERLAQLCDAAENSSTGVGGGGVVGGAVDAAVGSLLEAAPLVDPKAVRSAGDDELVRCARVVQRAVNVLEGARSTVAAEVTRRGLHARRGESTGAETLANATGLSGSLARRVEREAQVLGQRPVIAEMLGRGEINSDQAAVVAAADVPDEVRFELCERARHQSADQTRKTVRSVQAVWHQETDAQRRARQRAARSASMWVDRDDGMWNLRAKLDPLTGDAVHRRLVSVIERNWRTDKHLPEHKRRSVQQRAADALTALIAGSKQPPNTANPSSSTQIPSSTPPGETANSNSRTPTSVFDDERRSDAAGGRRADHADAEWVVPSPSQMIVLTTLDNLRANPAHQPPAPNAAQSAASSAPNPPGPPNQPNLQEASGASGGLLAVAGAAAVTVSGTALTAADARRIACDTQVIPAVMGSRSELLDIGRATRIIPAAIRRALIARDQGCVWPGCDRAPIHCDGHHLVHWVDDGPTSLANLALLCHAHHQRLHEYNLVLHPPTKQAPPGEGWTVTPATPRKERTPTNDHTRQNR